MGREQSLTYRIQAKSDRLERDLAAANKKLGRFKNQTKLNMDSIRNSFVGAFGGFMVLNMVTSAVKSLAGFELQMDKVAAISGATTKQMESLTKSALELGRTTIYTAGQIGKMQEELARLGFEPDRIMAASKAITKLALVTDSDLGEAAKTMAGTLNGFNLEATESGRVANVMAESFSKSALTMEKFTVGTSQSSAIARVFGATVEENTARLGKLTDANIDASKAGTDLRRMYINLNEKGMTWQEGMDMIAGSTDKMSTAVELFDVRAAGAAVILSTLDRETKSLATELSDTNKQIDHMANVMSGNLSTDWKLFTSAIDGTVQKGGALNGVLSDLLSNSKEYVDFINHEEIPVFVRIAGLFGGILTKSIRTHSIAVGEAIRLEKEMVKTTFDGIQSYTVQAKALELYTKATDKTRLGIDKMLLSANMAFDPNVSAIRVEILKLITQSENDQSKAILRKADALEKASLAQEEFNKKYQKFLSDNKTALGGKRDEAALGSVSGGDMETPMARLAEQMKLDLEVFKNTTGEYKDNYDKMTADMIQFNAELSMIINESLANTFASLGEAIGNGGGLKESLGAIASVIGSGISEIGKLMIAWGVAQIAFDTALKAIFGSGPAAGVAAIAAGTALVAAGAAVSNATKGLSDNLGGGGGGASGPSGRFIGGGQQSMSLEGSFMVKGSDLVYVINRQGGLDARQKAG